MPEYHHEQIGGGDVQLPSGTWRWYRTRLVSVPDAVCVLHTLSLAHAENLGSTMRLRVANDLVNFDSDDVADLALHPDERAIVVQGVQYVVYPSLDGTPGGMWQVRGMNNVRWATDWAVEEPLGALHEGDLLGIVGTHLG